MTNRSLKVLGLTCGFYTILANSLLAQTYTTVLDNGAPGNRVDIVFAGDGYLASQIDTVYAQHVDDYIDYMFNSGINPFPRYENFFNVHRVNVISNETGADQPPNGIFRDTALDASYWWGNSDIERLLYFDTTKAQAALSTALAGSGIVADMRIGTVNDSKYGGGGGSWGIYAGANSAATDIAIHEIGHSFASLADEYFYTDDIYTGPEPSNVNVTANPNSGKWDRWVGYEDPDTDIGPIGYYEGGYYNRYGIWRPSDNSEMRALFRPFDAISREQFISRIYDRVDPLDDWLDNAATLDDPSAVWVETLDPNVINVEWIVNGNSLGVLTETLDISSLGLPAGLHSITAKAYDAILDHSFTGNSLDWWRLPDTSKLRQSITWSVSLSSTITGDFDGNGLFGCNDIDSLVAEIVAGTNSAAYDLTGDGAVNLADRDAWLAEAGGAQNASGGAYLLGDANLDGIVDGIDFTIWNASKFTSTAAWCSGDFDANGVVDGIDFTLWNANKFTSADSIATTGGFRSQRINVPPVPEPASAFLLSIGLMTILNRRR